MRDYLRGALPIPLCLRPSGRLSLLIEHISQSRASDLWFPRILKVTKEHNMSFEKQRLIHPDVSLSTRELGAGSFAKVFLGHRPSTSVELAVKVVQRAKLNKKILDALESEIRILRAVQHPHIVQLHEIIVCHVIQFSCQATHPLTAENML